MKTIEMMRAKSAIIFLLCITILLISGVVYGEEGYPIKVEIIEKGQARYDTPENAFTALCSASIKEDIEWVYETFTKESAEELKKLYEEEKIDLKSIFDLEKRVKDTFIIGKAAYKGAIVLIIEYHDKDGTIIKIPATFVKEGEKWKHTNKFAGDDELAVYMDYVKPEEQEIISASIKIRPKRWNLNWYNWVKGHMGDREWIAQCAERISILSIIGNLKDNQGNHYRVDEILPETLLLNNVLPPQPWKFKEEEKIAIILKSRKDRNLRTRKGFKEWHRASRFFKKYQGPVMLVKFNKFKAMETLPAMIPGKEYDVTVSGELKDGKPFKGSTNITITEWRAKHRWKWNHPGWLNSDKDVDHWWNKEKDLEDLWEKISKHPQPKQRSGMKRYRQ